jgi:hypothetical protein
MEDWKIGSMEVEFFLCKSLLMQANKKFGNIKHQFGRMEVWKNESIFFTKHISLTVG